MPSLNGFQTLLWRQHTEDGGQRRCTIPIGDKKHLITLCGSDYNFRLIIHNKYLPVEMPLHLQHESPSENFPHWCAVIVTPFRVSTSAVEHKLHFESSNRTRIFCRFVNCSVHRRAIGLQLVLGKYLNT